MYLFFGRRIHSRSWLRQLSLGVGIFNTIVLLSSSWSGGRCVEASRVGTSLAPATWLTRRLRRGFRSVEGLRWAHRIRLWSNTISSDNFTYYFFLTGIHLLHVLIGFVVLGVAVYQIRGPRRPLSAVDRNMRNLLAHRRFPVGADLRDTLRGGDGGEQTSAGGG